MIYLWILAALAFAALMILAGLMFGWEVGYNQGYADASGAQPDSSKESRE